MKRVSPEQGLHNVFLLERTRIWSCVETRLQQLSQQRLSPSLTSLYVNMLSALLAEAAGTNSWSRQDLMLPALVRDLNHRRLHHASRSGREEHRSGEMASPLLV
jgi:hypothetical protein|tara:strand:+ start:363 stop:674 length:312 start_codon:yes stop_codon:yes gene_type:complete